METAVYDRVKGFFENEVTKFLLADLDRLGKIQDHPACTIPESLAIFSFVDLLGFLMRPQFDDENKIDLVNALDLQHRGKELDPTDAAVIKKLESRARATQDNLNYMCSTWLVLIRQDYGDPLNMALLRILFRHGGAHQFFPKIGSIGKNGEEQALIEIRAKIGNYPLTHLNQNKFREDFVACLSMMIGIIVQKDDKEMAKITGESIEKVIQRMNARLDARLYLDREQLLQILRTNAPDLLPHSSKEYKPASSYQYISYKVDPNWLTESGTGLSK
jgi:hypothetical protein